MKGGGIDETKRERGRGRGRVIYRRRETERYREHRRYSPIEHLVQYNCVLSSSLCLPHNHDVEDKEAFVIIWTVRPLLPEYTRVLYTRDYYTQRLIIIIIVISSWRQPFDGDGYNRIDRQCPRSFVKSIAPITVSPWCYVFIYFICPAQSWSAFVSFSFKSCMQWIAGISVQLAFCPKHRSLRLTTLFTGVVLIPSNVIISCFPEVYRSPCNLPQPSHFCCRKPFLILSSTPTRIKSRLHHRVGYFILFFFVDSPLLRILVITPNACEERPILLCMSLSFLSSTFISLPPL